MRRAQIDAIIEALLYEGYNLYPYRPSALKNRRRWTFGTVFPRDWAARDGGDPGHVQTQCLVRGGPDTILDIGVRFLHIVAREIGEPFAELPDQGEPGFRKVPALDVAGTRLVPWEEAREREVTAAPLPLGRLTAAPVVVPFAFPGGCEIEPVRAEGRIVALILRTAAPVAGEVAIGARQLAPDLYRATVRVENLTPLPPGIDREEAQRSALAAAHTLLGVRDGRFVSLTDPPAEYRRAAAECANQGTWPVLVGEEGSADTVLSSPIILYDYPRIAPESPGDLFDGTEIDEILTLRILTLTEDEKREMAAADPRTRALLERTEALTPEALLRLHGAFRDPQSGAPQAGTAFKVGDRVRLKPKAGGDVMDVALQGQMAVIEAIERDFEDRLHVAVTLLDDPGRDLGLAHMPGHRFFFAPDELVPVEAGAAP